MSKNAIFLCNRLQARSCGKRKKETGGRSSGVQTIAMKIVQGLCTFCTTAL